MSGATGPVPYSIIAPTSPFVDTKTGRITREWYRFLLSLFATGGSGQPQASPAQIQESLTQYENLTAALPTPPGGPDYRAQIEDLNTLVALALARAQSAAGASASFHGLPFTYGTLAWGAGTVAQNGTIAMEGYAQLPSHVLGVAFNNGAGGGSITGNFQINGTSITGLSAVVNNGSGISDASGANALPADGVLRVVLSSATGVIADGGYFTPFGTYD